MSLRRLAALVSPLAAACAVSLSSAPQAAADQTAPKKVTCEEKFPDGATRPQIKETFPGETVAGYEARLVLEIRHGKGETVLPNGFRVLPGSETAKALEEAGFAVAEASGGAPPVIEREDEGDGAITRVTIPFIVLPLKSGKVSLTVPQLPLTISRANLDTMTVCTQMHLIVASDPTAAEEDPKPHPNPPARPQIEDWPLMKWLLAGILLGLLIGALAAWWVRRQLKKPVPAPEPLRRLPWEEALLELEAIRKSPLLSDPSSSRAELYDRVSDVVRKYLGARYGFAQMGFDGLDTTTDEMLALLRRVRPGVPKLEDVRGFLMDCDLVKFARVESTQASCVDAIGKAEDIVRSTIPVAPAQAPAALQDPSAPPGPTPPPPPVAPPPAPPPPPEAHA